MQFNFRSITQTIGRSCYVIYHFGGGPHHHFSPRRGNLKRRIKTGGCVFPVMSRPCNNSPSHEPARTSLEFIYSTLAFGSQQSVLCYSTTNGQKKRDASQRQGAFFGGRRACGCSSSIVLWHLNLHRGNPSLKNSAKRDFSKESLD